MTLHRPSHADRSLSIKIDAGAPREFILRSFASGSPTGGRDRASCRHRRLHRKLAVSAAIVLAAIRKGQFLHLQYQVAGALASLRGGQSVFAYVATIKQRKKPNAGASSSPRERDHQPAPAARALALGIAEETLPRLRGNEGHGDKT